MEDNNYSSHKSLDINNISNYNMTEEKIKEENKKLKSYNESLKDCIKNLETEKKYNKFALTKRKHNFPSTTKNSKEKIKFTLKNNNINNYKKISINTSNNFNKSNLKNLKTEPITTKNQNKKFINFLLPNIKTANNSKKNIIKFFKDYKEKISLINKRRKTYSSLSNNIISSTITENKKKSITSYYLNGLINPNKGDLNDFLKVITKTKKKIQNYNFDHFKKMVYSRNLNENSKMKIISNVENLDKKILDLDKELIRVVEKNKI